MFLLTIFLLGSLININLVVADTNKYVESVYISTGDSHFLGGSLPVDSPASIEASFDMLKNVFGVQRIYWRGLQEAAWKEVMVLRQENFRSTSFHNWSHYLLEKYDLERLAVRTAHDMGMELWGVGTLGDWGATADTPAFTQFPQACEAGFRIKHPEWVPTDKYGYRHQGGPVELAYPDARKTLVDLHSRLTKEAGYDGIIFLSYVENFSLRFQDEFGFNKPIVDEFRRLYGINIRQQNFTRYASRTDWYQLRGKYLTKYLQELRASLPDGVKLGMFVNPRTPHMPGLWATLPHTYFTYGKVYFDLETWVQDDIVDFLAVYGGSSRAIQAKTVADCLWMTRDTNAKISFVTTGLNDPVWKPFYDRGLGAIYVAGEDQDYLLRSNIPEQTIKALKTGTLYEQMRFLSQIIKGTSTASVKDVLPFVQNKNMLMRRLAIFALAHLHDKSALPAIESALLDSENGVRCKAMQALRLMNRPESTAVIIESLAKFGNHPLEEMARDTIPSLRPFPRQELTLAALNNKSASVRRTILRAFGRVGATTNDITFLKQAMHDSDAYARAAAIRTMGTVKNSTETIMILIKELNNPDVAMSNRAVDALETVIKRSDRKTLNLRPQILKAIAQLFMKMGDNCKRDDKDWGYRSAGNALLAFGREGESVLRKFMNQDKDRRLAELAWRVLYFREKKGENHFNIISEKENEEAYKMRPAWLKTNEVIRITQDFEHDGIFGGNVDGAVGNVQRRSARWNHFGSKGPMLWTNISYSGKRCVRLIRGGNGLNGWVMEDNGPDPDSDYELRLWVYRESQGSFVIKTRNGATRMDETSVLISNDGSILLFDKSKKNNWVSAHLTISEQTWTHLIIRANRVCKTFQVKLVSTDGKESTSTLKVPLDIVEKINEISFYPQNPIDAACCLDNIELIELR